MVKQKKLKKIDPPCETCRPEVHPDNSFIVNAYTRCADQWDSADLKVSNSNIMPVIDLMIDGRENRLWLLDNLKIIINTISKEISQQRKKDREKQDKKNASNKR